MPLMASKINPRDPQFAENRQANQALADDLRARVVRIKLGGGEAARQRHLDRDKLLPRERVRRLLDSVSLFRDCSKRAQGGHYGDSVTRPWMLTSIARAARRVEVYFTTSATG